MSAPYRTPPPRLAVGARPCGPGEPNGALGRSSSSCWRAWLGRLAATCARNSNTTGSATLCMQHDATEFLKAFLAYTRPPALTGSWTRKVQSNEQVTIMDRGTAFFPPSFTTSDANAVKVSLQALINEWHNYMGMVTAFDTDSPLLCFQIDRFKPENKARVRRTHKVIVEAEGYEGTLWWIRSGRTVKASLTVQVLKGKGRGKEEKRDSW